MRRSPQYFRRGVFCLLVILCLPAFFPGYAFAESASESVSIPLSDANTVFDLANQKYKDGDFREALKLYENLLSAGGIRTVDVHYNIGNAQFKLGNYGKAIVAYRRALLGAPRDQDIIANLNHVRNLTVDKIDQTKSTQILREIFFFHYSLSKTETEISFVCAYIILVSLLMIWLIRKSTAIRRLAFIVLFLALMFGSSLFVKGYNAVDSGQAVVVVGETDVRTGPARSYMVSFSLHDGAEVEVRDSRNGWCQIELPDGRRGWLNDSDIENV